MNERPNPDIFEVIKNTIISEQEQGAARHKQQASKFLLEDDLDGAKQQIDLIKDYRDVAQKALDIINKAHQELSELGITEISFNKVSATYTERYSVVSEEPTQPPAFHPHLPSQVEPSEKVSEVERAPQAPPEENEDTSLPSYDQFRATPTSQEKALYEFIGQQLPSKEEMVDHLKKLGFKVSVKGIYTPIFNLNRKLPPGFDIQSSSKGGKKGGGRYQIVRLPQKEVTEVSDQSQPQPEEREKK